MIPLAVGLLILGLILLPDYSPGPGRHRAPAPVSRTAVCLIVLGTTIVTTTIGLDLWLT